MKIELFQEYGEVHWHYQRREGGQVRQYGCLTPSSLERVRGIIDAWPGRVYGFMNRYGTGEVKDTWRNGPCG